MRKNFVSIYVKYTTGGTTIAISTENQGGFLQLNRRDLEVLRGVRCIRKKNAQAGHLMRQTASGASQGRGIELLIVFFLLSRVARLMVVLFLCNPTAIIFIAGICRHRAIQPA